MATLKPSGLIFVFYFDKPVDQIQKDFESIEEDIKETKKSLKEKEEEIKTSLEAKELQKEHKSKRIKLMPSESKKLLSTYEKNEKTLHPSILMLEREFIKMNLYKRMAKRKEYQYYMYENGLSCFAYVFKENFSNFFKTVEQHLTPYDCFYFNKIINKNSKGCNPSFWGTGVETIFEICAEKNFLSNYASVFVSVPYKMTIYEM